MARYIEPGLGFVAFVAIWQLAASLSSLPKVLFPSPADVFRALAGLWQAGILYEYIWLSLSHYLLGVAAGAVIGVLLGLLISANARINDILMPLVNFTYAIVEVAWIPLLIWVTARRFRRRLGHNPRRKRRTLRRRLALGRFVVARLGGLHIFAANEIVERMIASSN